MILLKMALVIAGVVVITFMLCVVLAFHDYVRLLNKRNKRRNARGKWNGNNSGVIIDSENVMIINRDM